MLTPLRYLASWAMLCTNVDGLSRWVSVDPEVVRWSSRPRWGVVWIDSRWSLESSLSTPLRLVDPTPGSDLVIALIGVLDESRIASCLTIKQFIRRAIKQFQNANLSPLLAKAPIISTEHIPNHTMGEGEVLIIKHLSKYSYTEARQEVQDIPESASREIPLHSLNHLREEFLQLLKHQSDEWAP